MKLQLIILTGYPCSGLSYRARQLSASLEAIQEEYLASINDDGSDDSTKTKPRYKIHVVTSHDEAHPRTVYDNARSEKEARAVVYAKTKRALGRDSIVIVDGMNYIKGWRYQLWCEAKALSTTSCVVCCYSFFRVTILVGRARRHGSHEIDSRREARETGTFIANIELSHEHYRSMWVRPLPNVSQTIKLVFANANNSKGTDKRRRRQKLRKGSRTRPQITPRTESQPRQNQIPKNHTRQNSLIT